MNFKNRHIKTPEEKYGKQSLMNEVILFFKENKHVEDEELFETMPYLGICYLPENFNVYINGNLSYKEHNIYNERGGLKKCKVVEVNNYHIKLVYFNDNIYQICFLEIRKDHVVLKGNILKENK